MSLAILFLLIANYSFKQKFVPTENPFGFPCWDEGLVRGTTQLKRLNTLLALIKNPVGDATGK